MAKGNIAKNNVTNKIAHAFGSDYIGEVDKKIYVWADDGGERVQIAISMTCPKVNVDAPNPAENAKTGDWDFDEPSPAAAAPVEISVDEQRNIAELMNRLGL